MRFARISLPVALVALGAALLGAPSCASPTEIVLDLQTDVPYQAGVTFAVYARAEPGEEGVSPQTVVAQGWGADGKIGTATIVPKSSKNEKVFIRVVMGIGTEASKCVGSNPPGCIVARRELAFIAHSSLVVPVFLRQDCVSIGCGEGTTCVKSRCVPSQATCGPEGCVVPGEGIPDAGADAKSAEGGFTADGGSSLDAGPACPGHFFCDHFDRSTAPEFGWTKGPGAATLVLDTSTFVSGPKSVLIEQGRLRKYIGIPAGNTATVTFNVRLKPTIAASAFLANLVTFGSYCEVGLYAFPSDAGPAALKLIGSPGNVQVGTLKQGITPGVWAQVHYVYRKLSSSGEISYEVDGVNSGTYSTSCRADTIEIGAESTQIGYVNNFDDVVMDLSPN